MSSGGRDVERALVVRGSTAVQRNGDGNSAVTPAMRVALGTGAAVFLLGALVQLVVLAWFAIAVGIVAVSGSILARTGGLDPATFATCVRAALALDGFLVVGIIGAWITRHTRRAASVHATDGYYIRHPVATTAAGLLLALGAVTLAGWRRSAYFPYPLATIVVLANAYFFALVSVLCTGKLVERAWPPLKSWAYATSYRTGILTATFVLLGGAGFALREARWQDEPARRFRAEVDLEPVRGATSFAEVQLRTLCIAAGEVSPELSRGDAAPGCRFLGDGSSEATSGADTGGDCFELLAPRLSDAKARIRTTLRINAYDADEIVMQALVATCTRVPPPDDVVAYFSTVARYQGYRATAMARRAVDCELDQLASSLPACSPGESPEQREAKLAALWQAALCHLTDRQANVLRSRLVDGLSFRAVGERWRLTETEARTMFHNIIKKLRRLELASCF